MLQVRRPPEGSGLIFTLATGPSSIDQWETGTPDLSTGLLWNRSVSPQDEALRVSMSDQNSWLPVPAAAGDIGAAAALLPAPESAFALKEEWQAAAFTRRRLQSDGPGDADTGRGKRSRASHSREKQQQADAAAAAAAPAATVAADAAGPRATVSCSLNAGVQRGYLRLSPPAGPVERGVSPRRRPPADGPGALVRVVVPTVTAA